MGMNEEERPMILKFQHGGEPTLDGGQVDQSIAASIVRLIRREEPSRIQWNAAGDGGQVELALAEAELFDQTPARTAELHAVTGLGVQGPGGTYKPDASAAPAGETCANCGRPGMWISGAGRVLCVKHQDDY